MDLYFVGWSVDFNGRKATPPLSLGFPRALATTLT